MSSDRTLKNNNEHKALNLQKYYSTFIHCPITHRNDDDRKRKKEKRLQVASNRELSNMGLLSWPKRPT